MGRTTTAKRACAFDPLHHPTAGQGQYSIPRFRENNGERKVVPGTTRTFVTDMAIDGCNKQESESGTTVPVDARPQSPPTVSTFPNRKVRTRSSTVSDKCRTANRVSARRQKPTWDEAAAQTLARVSFTGRLSNGEIDPDDSAARDGGDFRKKMVRSRTGHDSVGR